jgi:small subunit ribosomal protein S20
MANLKASKKSALTIEKRRQRNVARRSELRSTTKKIMDALAANDITTAQELMKTAESKIARARGKGVVKKQTASRKIGRLAKKVSAAARSK